MHIDILKNEEFDFRDISDQSLREQAEKAISDTNNRIEKLTAIQNNDRTFDNTMKALDELFSRFSQVFSTIYLLAYVIADDEARNEAQAQIAVLDKYANALSLNEDLYLSVKAYAHSVEAQKLTGYKKRFTEKTLLEYERNGFALSKEKRTELKEIKDKISDFSLQFDTNIAENEDFLIFTEQDLDGLPEDYKKAHITENGDYKIALDYPTFRPFMKYAHSSEARKKLQFLFYNRAAEANTEILQKVLKERKNLANLLGYKTYADYGIEDKMAKTSEIVWNFEKDLETAVRSKALIDLQELKTISGLDTIQIWDAAYFADKLMREKYAVDQEEVKQYFSLEKVLSGLLHLSEQLFSVQFNKIDNAKAWHADVQVFELIKDGKLKGRFYLDLYPRPKKYNHAAMFPMVSGMMLDNEYQIPVASLVTNFPKPTDEKPSLLPHNEVTTFFHEFGHLLHGLLTESPLGSVSGTSVAHDFVETPSQLLENWAWNYDSLSHFAKHYQTGELLPKALYQKLWEARNVGSGLHILQQIFYGQLDMYYHNIFNAEKENTTEIVEKLQNKITYYPFMENTHFEASFGHLMGYAAGYYGYLWSLVFSADIFSEFEKHGVLSKELGEKLQKEILSKGSTVNEYEQMKAFLGREPNNEAFLKSIGL
jgi:thimet oligopeptidase